MKTWKVYGLKEKGTNDIRYVDVTSQMMRRRIAIHKNDARIHQQHNPRLNWIREAMMSGSGLDYQVLEDNIHDEQEAFDREVFWISQFQNLTNTASGGKGVVGYKHSEETRIRMSEAQKGKQFTAEHIKNIQNSRTSIAKKVEQYTKTGEYVRTWDTIKAAAEFLDTDAGQISKCCKGKKGVKSAGGYLWKYAEVVCENQNYLSI